MEIIVVGLVALIGGFMLGAKLTEMACAPKLNKAWNEQAIDRANYLQTLRRELANQLVWRDPQRFLQLYRHLHSEVASFGSWRPEEVRKRLYELCRKYPNYDDFDAIGTREYVLYPDRVSSFDDTELEDCYRDMVTFVALSVIADPTWNEAASRGCVHKLSEEELAHLTKYVRKIEDTKLRLRIEQAVDAYYAWRDDQTGILNNDFYSVHPLHHFAETRYGIHLKRTNEFAIYAFFMFDDGRTSHSYYRSDPTFEKEEDLCPLHAVLEAIRPIRPTANK
ncbi:MAG: hypothetical protein B7Y80_19010 [Hyphomicrobium sp. 32-62-53]|nr:MAG: hypothetical protein B7Z29_17700 [Hyphomicrobium sp. 12-62-95]OYX97703.1 MAG: hypothetical protein B7Y80_19010 [Hyphomicrobium sp. 32-62-53]